MSASALETLEENSVNNQTCQLQLLQFEGNASEQMIQMFKTHEDEGWSMMRLMSLVSG